MRGLTERLTGWKREFVGEEAGTEGGVEARGERGQDQGETEGALSSKRRLSFHLLLPFPLCSPLAAVLSSLLILATHFLSPLTDPLLDPSPASSSSIQNSTIDLLNRPSRALEESGDAWEVEPSCIPREPEPPSSSRLKEGRESWWRSGEEE